MLRLAEVVRHHGPAYVERNRASILPSHVRALQSIVHCRTPILGGHVAVCAACGTEHLLYHSCRHRACPQCGRDATTRWIARQRDLLLPVKYFHVVFTVPHELRRVLPASVREVFPSACDSRARVTKAGAMGESFRPRRPEGGRLRWRDDARRGAAREAS